MRTGNVRYCHPGETAADARNRGRALHSNREAVKREVERRVKERMILHVTVITAGWPQLPPESDLLR